MARRVREFELQFCKKLVSWGFSGMGDGVTACLSRHILRALNVEVIQRAIMVFRRLFLFSGIIANNLHIQE
jgi:hypothetical protein